MASHKNACPLIRQALLGLLAHERLDKVTVSEIAAAAGVNRKTLYYYYDGKDDIVEDVLREAYRVVTGCSPDVELLVVTFDVIEVDAMTRRNLQRARENVDLMQPLMTSELADTFREFLWSRTTEHVRGLSRPLVSNERDLDLVARCKYLSFFEVFRNWTASGCAIPIDEVLKQLWTVFDRSLEPLHV